MMEEWITRKSPEYRELQEKALAALDRIEAMIETLPSHLNAETYLTSEEVRNLFGLSQRSLQTYRDERIIPYTAGSFSTRCPRLRRFSKRISSNRFSDKTRSNGRTVAPVFQFNASSCRISSSERKSRRYFPPV